MVISSHIEVLSKLPKVESTGEVKILRSLYNTVESRVRGLETIYAEITRGIWNRYHTNLESEHGI